MEQQGKLSSDKTYMSEYNLPLTDLEYGKRNRTEAIGKCTIRD